MSQVPNLTFESLSPTYKRGIFCDQCQKYMRLLSTDGSISRDFAAHSWRCNCKCIETKNIKLAFDRCVETFKDVYQLHKLEYHTDTRYFEIESAQWISPNESRVNAQRKIINVHEREDILSVLKQAVEDALGIEIENFGDIFAE